MTKTAAVVRRAYRRFVGSSERIRPLVRARRAAAASVFCRPTTNPPPS